MCWLCDNITYNPQTACMSALKNPREKQQISFKRRRKIAAAAAAAAAGDVMAVVGDDD